MLIVQRLMVKDWKIFFVKDWQKRLKESSSGKLCSYYLFNNNFGCENYLSFIKNFEYRRSLARFLYQLTNYISKLVKNKLNRRVPRWLLCIIIITVYNRTVLKNGSCCTVRPGKVSCLQKFRHFWMIIRDLFFESGSTESTK
jgi:hypothetical protein